MVAIKPGSGEFGGVNIAPEGEHEFEFNGTAVRCGRDNQTLRLEAVYLQDTSTRPVSIFCHLGSERGLENLMSVIFDSGVYKKMMKKTPNLPDPETVGWDADEILRKDAFLQQLGIEIEGCRVRMIVEHEDNKWKNDKGEEVITPQARCRKILPSINGSTTASPGVPAVDFD